MAKHDPTVGASHPRDPRTIAEEEKRLEEELLTQEQLESLAWPIRNDIETRIAHAVQAHNASSTPQKRLRLAHRQKPYQMLVQGHDAGQALSIELNTRTGVISFGNPGSGSEDRLVVRIEGESSYRIERYDSAQTINPGEIARVILDKLLNPGSDSAE
jgi:hypothetical protein